MILTVAYTSTCVWWLAPQCPVTLPAWLKGAVPAILFRMWFIWYGMADKWWTRSQGSLVDCEIREVLGAFRVWFSPSVRQNWWNSVCCSGSRWGWCAEAPGENQRKAPQEIARRGRWVLVSWVTTVCLPKGESVITASSALLGCGGFLGKRVVNPSRTSQLSSRFPSLCLRARALWWWAFLFLLSLLGMRDSPADAEAHGGSLWEAIGLNTNT